MIRVVALFLLLSMAACASISPESEFWGWFQSHSDELKAVKRSDAPIMDTLHERMRAVHDDLTYEMSMHDGAVREIIISGGGLVEMIPVVRRLTAAAPRMDGWKVIAFRPRMRNYMGFSMKHSGHIHDPASIWFHPVAEDGYIDLIVYHPHYSEAERGRFDNALYILLDMALGEFDVMTKVRRIDFQRLPENAEAQGLIPFARLREVFDDIDGKRKRN